MNVPFFNLKLLLFLISQNIREAVTQSVIQKYFDSLFVGCYKDDIGDYSILHSPRVSQGICIKHCRADNFSFAALKAGKQCYCIENYMKTRSAHCYQRCIGNPWQLCGGTHESSIFRTSNTSTSLSHGNDLFESSGCSVDSKPDHSSRGGTWFPYGTWKECRNGCFLSLNTTCKYGFEWASKNPALEQCWFSANITFKKNGNNLYTFDCRDKSSPDYIPYSKSGCSVVLVSNHMCPDQFIQPVVTWEECRDDCFRLKSTLCKYGFNWNVQEEKDRRCTFSKSGNLVTVLAIHNYKFDCTGTAHVTSTPSILEECEWIYLPGITTPGFLVPTETEDQCRDGCFNARNTHCQNGYYWLSVAKLPSERCYFSYQLLLQDSTESNYSKYECSDSDCRWVRKLRTSSFRRSSNPSKKFSECKNRCYILRNTECKYGFDFERKRGIGMQCWFSDDETTKFMRYSSHYVFSCPKRNYTMSTTTEVPGFSVCNRDNHCDTRTTKCLNYSIGYRCECRTGYSRASLTYMPYKCQDIDECKTFSYWCDENSHCVNTIGSYICYCDAAKSHQYVPSGHSCKNTEPCTSTSCDNKSSICLNMLYGFQCSCLRNMIPYDSYSCVEDFASDDYEYEDYTEKMEGLKQDYSMFVAGIGSIIVVLVVILQNKLTCSKKTMNSGFSSTGESIMSGRSIRTI